MAIITNEVMELSRGAKVRVTSHLPTANVLITVDSFEFSSSLHITCAEAERFRDMLTEACAAMKPAAKQESRARLIAAAPKLLEMCKLALAIRRKEHPQFTEEGEEIGDPICYGLAAVIVEAEGV